MEAPKPTSSIASPERLRDELRNFIASDDCGDFGSGDIVLFNFEGLKALLADCERKADACVSRLPVAGTRRQ